MTFSRCVPAFSSKNKPYTFSVGWLTNSIHNGIVIAIDEFYINRKEADRVDENEVSRSTKRDLEE